MFKWFDLINLLFNISTYLMGAECCAGDIFKKLYDQHGDNFVKLMVAEKGKDIIRDEFGKTKTNVDSVFTGYSNQTNTLVDGKLGDLTKIYESTKQKVNIGGALEMLEKQQGKPIDEISGFNGMKGQLNGIRKDTLGKIDEQHNNIMTKMNSSQDDMVTKIEKDRPKIELY